jgi:hypothetical protein
MIKYLTLLAVAIFAAGCHDLPVRAHGGKVTHVAADGARAELSQPENPKDSSKQDFDIDDDSSVIVPAGATIKSAEVVTVAGQLQTNVQVFTVPTNTVISHHHSEHSKAVVGASQIDQIGDTIAKLKSTKWWSVFGFFVFIGGVFLALYPATQAFLGGPMPGAGVAIAGLIIAVLPILLVGHETLIIGGAAVAGLAALGIWYAHNHGGVMAELNVLKTKAESELKKL